METVCLGVKDKAKIKIHDYLFLPLVKILPQTIKPNHVSALRFAMTLPLILLMWQRFYKLTGLLFILAALLDALDGSMARLRDQETKLGAFLDPTADKAVNFAVFLGFLFYIKSNYYFGLIMPILIIDLLLFQIALAKYLVHDIIPKNHWLCQSLEIKKMGANNWGKAKMVTQVIVLSLLLLFDPETSITIHQKYTFLPLKLTLLHFSFPLLIICIILGTNSLIGHLQVIKFNGR